MASSTAYDINTPEYWEHRFKTDWKEQGGHEQTEFFGRVALDLMPEWLLTDISARGLSITDFGCGEGEAAGLLKNRFARSRVAGVDVSATAVKHARARIEGVEFHAGDADSIPDGTDVVFCSNTLEHFHQPKEMLGALLRRAGAYAVLLVPFRENPREREHFVTFDFDSFPVGLEGFSLAAYRTIDCKPMPNTGWLGQQLLVVYGKPAALEQAGVTLANLDAIADELRTELARTKREASERQQQQSQELQRVEQRYQTELDTVRREERALREMLAQSRIYLDEMNRNLDEIRGSTLYKSTRLVNKARHPGLGDVPRALLWASGAYRHAGIGLLDALRAGDPLLGIQQGIERAHRAMAGLPLDPPPPPPKLFSPLVRRVVRAGWDQVADRSLGRALKSSAPPAVKQLVRQALFAPEATGPAPVPSVEDQYRASLDHIRRTSTRPYDEQRFAKERREIEERAKTARGVVVYLPTINWGYLFQRPHQIVRELARKGYLCFFCPAIPADDGVDGLKEVEPNLLLCSDVRMTFGLPNTLIWVNWPVNRAYENHFAGARVVYEYIDELEVFHLYCKLMQEDHDALVKNADVVVATADRLQQQIKPVRPDVVLAPNGVDPTDFRPTLPPPVPDDLAPILARGRPIVGYYGALAKWFDYELLNEVTAKAPDLSFVMIGPDYDGSASQLARRDNVFVLGQKGYKELAAYSTRFDVATVPFKINEITRSTSPVKLFEYMAAGAAIVTTPMDECRKYKSVKIAGTADEFVTALREAIELRKDDGYQALLAREALENTWSRRVDDILAQLEKSDRKRGAA